MGNPETPRALPIADNLDENHRAAAIRQGSETVSKLERLASEAAARRLAATAKRAEELGSSPAA